MAFSAIKTVTLLEPEEESIALSAEVYVPQESLPGLSTFLLLPYWGGTARTYSAIQGNLIKGCPSNASIAVSYKGTGKAFDRRTIDDDAARHSIGELAEDVLRFLQSPQLAEVLDVSSLIICAHSMSAKIGLQMISILPEAFTLRSTLLLAPAGPMPLTLPPDVRSGQLTAYDSIESATWTIKNVLAGSDLDEEAVEQLVEDSVGYSNGAKKGWIEIGMAECLVIVLRDENERLRTAPIRVLAGAQDKVETYEKVETETVATLREWGLNVELTQLEDCGHLIPVEKPDAVTRELCNLAQMDKRG